MRLRVQLSRVRHLPGGSALRPVGGCWYVLRVSNPEERADDDAQAALKRALPEEWREDQLGWPAVQDWEADHGVVLPEPYRTLIAQVSNGSALGPSEDGGLLPLGWLPDDWPYGDERQPALTDSGSAPQRQVDETQMSRTEAVDLVLRIMAGDYTSEIEADSWV